MKLRLLMPLAMFLVLVGNVSVEARPNDGSMWAAWESDSIVTAPGARNKGYGKRQGARSYSRSSSSGVGGRPRQWCGWWMRTQKGGGPAYNLAWNWRNYGSPTGPQVGAVVVWRHHVGMITGRAANGQWIVKSGNDSGRVRERARSVSGAIFRI